VTGAKWEKVTPATSATNTRKKAPKSAEDAARRREIARKNNNGSMINNPDVIATASA